MILACSRNVGEYYLKCWHNDDRQTQVRWYFVPDDANCLPIPHAFQPTHLISPGLVGVPGSGQVGACPTRIGNCNPKHPKLNLHSTQYCGTASQWLNGSDIDTDLPLTWHEYGYSQCCMDNNPEVWEHYFEPIFELAADDTTNLTVPLVQEVDADTVSEPYLVITALDTTQELTADDVTEPVIAYTTGAVFELEVEDTSELPIYLFADGLHELECDVVCDSVHYFNVEDVYELEVDDTSEPWLLTPVDSIFELEVDVLGDAGCDTCGILYDVVTGITCNSCVEPATQYKVTCSGMTDENCECSVFNGTHIMTFVSQHPSGVCGWASDPITSDCSNNLVCWWILNAIPTATPPVWRVSVGPQIPAYLGPIYELEDSSWNCFGVNTLTLIYDGTGCDAPATVTVEPVT